MTNSAFARLRIAVLLTTVALAVVLLLANAVGASKATPSVGAQSTTCSHVVENGETLWEIAAELDSGGQDVRQAVFAIQQVNALKGSLIVPGQVLALPVCG